MELKTYFAQDASGNIMPGASVTVYLANTTTLATGLQDESGSPLSNPFTADSSAKVSFYAPDGLYDITVVGNGRTVTIRAQFVSVDGASVLRSDLAAPGGSALVGFQQGGTGAVATTVQEVLRETVSVKRFGASPAATAAANAAAINAALASGALSVSVPDDGIYLVNATITVPAGVTFYGASKARIKLADNSFAGSGVVISAASGAVVKDIAVDGNIQNNTGQVSGIYALNPAGITISGCTVTNTEYGIRVTNGNNIKIYGNTVDGCLFYGISVKLASTSDTCYNVAITNNTCKNIASDGTAGADGQGIVVYGATGLLLTDYKNITKVIVNDNICHNCAAHGITLIAVSDFVVSGNNCYDCLQNTTFGSGICISEACKNGTVSNNTCTTCYDAGILLDVVDQAGNRFIYGFMSVTGNSCDRNTSTGIKVNSMPHTTISGNNCSNSIYGIFLAKGGFNNISGNTISYCSGNGIRLPGIAGATGDDQSHVVIADNIIDNCVAASNDQFAAIFLDYFSVVKIQGNILKGNTQDLTIQSTCSEVTLLDNRFTGTLYIDTSASVKRWMDEFRTTAAGKVFYSNDVSDDAMPHFRVDAGFTVPHFGLEWVPILAVSNVISSLTKAIADGGFVGQKIKLINYNSPTITVKHNAGTNNIGSVDVVLAYGEIVEYVWRGANWTQTVAKVATSI